MSTDPQKDDLLERVLGGTYKITKKIGEGGMGIVYQAEHVRLPKSFAVKVLSAAVAPESELYHRFRREAEICSRLKHEHIVDVVDFNLTEDGRPYLVMELLEGEDLATRLDLAGRLPIEKVIDILGQVTSALTEAHEQGVVHRDLKPQNIFLCQRRHQDDYVKLVDFGISKIQGAGSVLTATGAFVGTPVYMSPEQTGAGGAKVDHRTDIYALGVITYQLLTGRLPFEGENFAQLVLSIISKPAPSLTAVAPDLPPAVDAVIQRALAKDPAARFQTATAFYDALRAAVQGGAEVQSVSPAGMSSPGLVAGFPTLPFTPSPRASGRTAAPLLESTSPPGLFIPQPPPQEQMATGPTILADSADQSDSMELSPESKRGHRALLIGVGAASVTATATLALLFAFGGRGRTKSNNAARASALAGNEPIDTALDASVPLVQIRRPRLDSGPVSPRKPEPPQVVIQLRGLPNGARCQVDGRAVQGSRLLLARSAREITLQCEAEGHKPFSQTLPLNKDSVVDVSLPPFGPISASRHTVSRRNQRRPGSRRSSARRSSRRHHATRHAARRPPRNRRAPTTRPNSGTINDVPLDD